MNRLRRALVIIACASLGTPFVDADIGTPAPKVERHETELEKTMTKMGKAWRKVRKANREGTLSPALAADVQTVRQNAELAAKMTPALEAEQPVPDRAKFQANYEAQLKKLVKTLGELEKALSAGENETATKLIGDVGDLMKSGHNDYKKPDEREAGH